MRLFLLGPLRLVDAEGRDVTPGPGLQRAILAVLALAPHGTVTRVRLQDLFWAEKDPSLAAQSLRTALHGLRRSLGALSPSLLATDETSVTLSLDALVVDLLTLERGGPLPFALRGEIPDVLEGLNPRLGGAAEEFEDWLRSQRSYWCDRIETRLSEPAPAPRPAPAAEPLLLMPGERDPDRPILGLLLPVLQGGGVRARFLADAVLDRLALSLRDDLGAVIFDYRELGGEIEMAGPIEEPALYLRLHLYQEGDWCSIRIVALGQGCREMAWSSEVQLDGAFAGPIGETAAGFFADVVVQAADTIEQLRARADGGATVSPFHAMTVMFQCDHGALEGLRRQIDESWDRTGDAIYLSLAAYLNTFRVAESWGRFDEDLRTETLELIAADPMRTTRNGLACALAGHATGFILHDRDGADDWLTRALKLSPRSAFAWDHLALHRAYAGRFTAAQEAAARAVRLGGGSPIRFSYETTQCMIATLQGDFDGAAAIGQSVLAQRPDYPPVMRYTAVSLAHGGQTDAAKALLGKVRRLDPSFSTDWADQTRMSIVVPEARQLLRAGLARAGI
ncbi:tetratricopeptide repeat protein [Frigidibacter sp. MR17.24]|uniref:tetratricopeptide repeat protein n=1 Tax=Frigidibacter sp. MR17.24 TaxID=3127345 RepID=UPI003012A19A